MVGTSITIYFHWLILLILSVIVGYFIQPYLPLAITNSLLAFYGEMQPQLYALAKACGFSLAVMLLTWLLTAFTSRVYVLMSVTISRVTLMWMVWVILIAVAIAHFIYSRF